MQATREEEIRDIHGKYKDFYQIGGGVLLVCIGIWIGSLIFQDGYATNVYTELMSVIVTILVLDRLNDWRARNREREALQKRLIREAGGQSNEMAKAAIDWMRDEGWLTGEDGLLINRTLAKAKLQGAYLKNANLKGANLDSGNLEGANLVNANLKHVNLVDANLQCSNVWDSNLVKAVLYKANLKHARILNTNLQDADLAYSNLEDCYMVLANLKGANLYAANLRSADIADAQFSEQTVLPDAKNIGSIIHPEYDKYWTPETDMSRYTDPNHPDFWEPDWVKEQRETGEG